MKDNRWWRRQEWPRRARRLRRGGKIEGWRCKKVCYRARGADTSTQCIVHMVAEMLVCLVQLSNNVPHSSYFPFVSWSLSDFMHTSLREEILLSMSSLPLSVTPMICWMVLSMLPGGTKVSFLFCWMWSRFWYSLRRLNLSVDILKFNIIRIQATSTPAAPIPSPYHTCSFCSKLKYSWRGDVGSVKDSATMNSLLSPTTTRCSSNNLAISLNVASLSCGRSSLAARSTAVSSDIAPALHSTLLVNPLDRLSLLPFLNLRIPIFRSQSKFMGSTSPSRSISTLNALDMNNTGREGDVDVAWIRILKPFGATVLV